jgi:hypothetical protein
LWTAVAAVAVLRCCAGGAVLRGGRVAGAAVLRGGCFGCGGCSSTWWSSRSLQSASVSLSRKDCSSVVSLALYVSSRCLRLGEPVKMSRSKPAAPRHTVRGTAEAGMRTVGAPPVGKLPCAFSMYSTQEAGARSPHAYCTEAPGACQHRSKPTVPQPSATFSVSLILGICFCASLYAAAVRKPRDCSAIASPGTCRVERRACMGVRWRL